MKTLKRNKATADKKDFWLGEEDYNSLNCD